MKTLVAQLNTHLHIINAFLLSTIVMSSMLYIYFVTSAVSEVVLRQEMSRAISELESQIAVLESKYMAAQLVVSERIAMQNEYQETREKVFIERTTPSLVLGEVNN